MPRKLAAGNWKMNGAKADLAMIRILGAETYTGVDVLICPPATLIAASTGHGVTIGAQDCHIAASGAHTGDLSAEMLVDAGARYIITGHSERRADHGETNTVVKTKSEAAYRAGAQAIICIGETLAQREAGTTLGLIETQLAGSVPDSATAQNTVIAYEPVWAIGTGKVPTIAQIAEVHAHIRMYLAARFTGGADFTVLYGGSVKAGNAADIFAVADVDGALVGGASLKVADFAPIITALESA
jgi:triosephosphate isomerase